MSIYLLDRASKNNEKYNSNFKTMELELFFLDVILLMIFLQAASSFWRIQINENKRSSTIPV